MISTNMLSLCRLVVKTFAPSARRSIAGWGLLKLGSTA